MQKLTKYSFVGMPNTKRAVVFGYGNSYDEAFQDATNRIAEESIVKEDEKSDTKEEVRVKSAKIIRKK